MSPKYSAAESINHGIEYIDKLDNSHFSCDAIQMNVSFASIANSVSFNDYCRYYLIQTTWLADNVYDFTSAPTDSLPREREKDENSDRYLKFLNDH